MSRQCILITELGQTERGVWECVCVHACVYVCCACVSTQVHMCMWVFIWTKARDSLSFCSLVGWSSPNRCWPASKFHFLLPQTSTVTMPGLLVFFFPQTWVLDNPIQVLMLARPVLSTQPSPQFHSTISDFTEGNGLSVRSLEPNGVQILSHFPAVQMDTLSLL